MTGVCSTEFCFTAAFDENRGRQRQIESGSNLCVVFQGGEDLCESSKLQHGVLVGVELVERLRFISLIRKDFKEIRFCEDNFSIPSSIQMGWVQQTSWVLMMGEKTEYSAQRSSNSLVRTRPKRPLPEYTVYSILYTDH